MRILIIVSSIVLQSFVGQCQLSLLRDLYANANFTPSMITQNQATTCELGIVNNNWTGGTGTKDTLYVGSVTVQLSWTARCNAINTVPTGTWASKFNWTFYPAGTPGRTHGGWDGISNQNIIEIAGTILFSTTGKNTGSNVTGANINVIINPPFGDSFQNDNSTSPLITVSTPAPVELSGFDTYSRNCSSVDLTWNTLSERNNAYFEVLRSSDGKEFLSLGKVEGTNASQGSRYVFTDEKHLVSGSKYLYRLRQVDFDGKTTYHDVISYVHYCEGERSVFGVFPNPAFDRINTVFTGPFSEEVALLLLGNDGTVLRKMNTSPVNGQIDISNLPSGVYQLKVVSASEEFIAKFIKID